MEFFTKTMAVKLRSHLDKCLIADPDFKTVRQTRTNASSRRATWLVELIPERNGVVRLDVVRLRSCFGTYLTASDSPFLLGVTGRKVTQTSPDGGEKSDALLEWRPVRDGFQVRLVSSFGKYLRGNGGTPPWRNSVTHDDPAAGATRKWILWDVDSAMDFFLKAKAVRLRSHHDKYLHADDDEESVLQDRNGSSKNAKWTVELVPGSESVIRLKSCYSKYLTASDHPYLLGMTGRKVLQTSPRRLDSSVEWEPVREGAQIKLRTRYGNFLRANGGLPPWRNSVTHDIPHRTATQDWVLWDIDVVEIQVLSPAAKPSPPPLPHSVSLDSGSVSSDSAKPANVSRLEVRGFVKRFHLLV
ncbi:hypothetical protein LINGRAHAP2_LOCUS34963 [Linum grandiflorum]